MSLEHTPVRGAEATPGHPGQGTPDRLIGTAEVCRITSLSRTTIWRLERAGNFARRRKIAPNRVGWILSEVLLWMTEREAA